MNRPLSFFVAAILAFSVVRPAFAQVADLTSATAPTATAGDLVKCPDFSSVYYLAADGQRYVYPNERIFYSWNGGFDGVVDISCDDLAALPLGGAVTYQAGSTLLKLESDPSVYAVEDGGVLREIEDEVQAEALYGDDWADQVDDLPDGFFGEYEVGDPLADGEVPDGVVVTDDAGNVFRSQDGEFVESDELVTEDVSDRLASFAERKDDIVARFAAAFGKTLAFNAFDSETISAFLSDLMRMLSVIDVPVSDEVDVEIDGIDDGTDDAESEDSAEDASDVEEDDEDGDGLKDAWETEWHAQKEAEDVEDAAGTSGDSSNDAIDDSSDDSSSSDSSSSGSSEDSVDSGDDASGDSSDDSSDETSGDSNDSSGSDSSDDSSGSDSGGGSDSSGGSDD